MLPNTGKLTESAMVRIMVCTPRCVSDGLIVPLPGGGRKAIVAMVNIDGSDGSGFAQGLMASSRAGSPTGGTHFNVGASLLAMGPVRPQPTNGPIPEPILKSVFLH
ncbi:Secreted protein [Pseudomonas serboccidentalis]